MENVKPIKPMYEVEEILIKTEKIQRNRRNQ
jgi:hypothetical protein